MRSPCAPCEASAPFAVKKTPQRGENRDEDIIATIWNFGQPASSREEKRAFQKILVSHDVKRALKKIPVSHDMKRAFQKKYPFHMI
jgi:hypothetical protein